mgnify:CR=1 FL=1
MLVADHESFSTFLKVSLGSTALHVAHAPFNDLSGILSSEVEPTIEDHYNYVGLAVISDHRVVVNTVILAPSATYPKKRVIPRHRGCPLYLTFLAEVEASLKPYGTGMGPSSEHWFELMKLQAADHQNAQINATGGHLIVLIR